MKLRKIILPAVIAMAGMALSTPASKGVNPPQGDLFLGAYDTTSSAFDYLVDVGSMTNFTGGTLGTPYTGPTITLNTDAFKPIGTAAHVTTDLNKVSATWFSSSSVLFGAIAETSSGINNVLYVSDPNATSTTPALTSTDSSTQGTAAGDVFGTLGPTYASHIAGNSPVSNGSVQNGSQSGSWYDLNPNGTVAPGSSFEIFSGDISTASRSFYLVELVATDAAANGLTAGTSEVLGKFTVGSDGTITYGAVPEPSAYAMIAIAAASFLVWKMKRNSAVNSFTLAS